MNDELTAVNPSEVTVIHKLKESRYSVVFHVRVRGKECVMKVVGGPSIPSLQDIPDSCPSVPCEAPI